MQHHLQNNLQRLQDVPSLPVRHRGLPSFLIFSSFPGYFSYLHDETAVDLLNDLVYTRKQSGEQLDRPFLKCFCHDGMVGVSTGFVVTSHASSQPRPSSSIRIRISSATATVGCVSFIWNVTFSEVSDIIMCFFIFAIARLNTCRYKEILLFQTKLFSCHMVVIWIKHFYDVLCKVFLLYCFLIITFVKRIQLEVVDCLCIPDTKCITIWLP